MVQNIYKPQGSQLEFLKCKEKCIIYSGPAGTGKTFTVLQKIDYLCRKYAGIRVLICRATRVSMSESTLVTLENHVLNDFVGERIKQDGASRHNRKSYKYPNGSEIIVGGLDRPSRLLSTEYDYIFIGESTEIEEEAYETLLTRLRNQSSLTNKQMVLDANPTSPSHWIFRKYQAGSLYMIKSSHEDNPVITTEYLESLKSLTGHRRARLYEGRWCQSEGCVYPTFKSCVVEPYELDDEFDPLMRGGLDWGFNDPFSAVLADVYFDDYGKRIVYVWYNRYVSKISLDVHAAALKSVMQSRGENKNALWYCDSSRPEQLRDLKKLGFDALMRRQGAVGNILYGIDLVNKYIANGTLQVSGDCKQLIQEAELYSFNPKGGDNPIDANNHLMDALRYLIVGVDKEFGT